MPHLSLVGPGPTTLEHAQSPEPDRSIIGLAPDPMSPIGSPTWLAHAPVVVGRNVGRFGAQAVVVMLEGQTWDEDESGSPYALTMAVARCLAQGGKVRALPVLEAMSPADRAFFMARMADAMGPAARGLERQL